MLIEQVENTAKKTLLTQKMGKHPVTFGCEPQWDPDLTLVPGLGSLVRHSECSDEWLDTKGTCYRPRHAHTLPS